MQKSNSNEVYFNESSKTWLVNGKIIKDSTLTESERNNLKKQMKGGVDLLISSESSEEIMDDVLL